MDTEKETKTDLGVHVRELRKQMCKVKSVQPQMYKCALLFADFLVGI